MSTSKSLSFTLLASAAALFASFSIGEEAAMKVVTDEANALGNVINAIDEGNAKPAEAAEAPAAEEAPAPAEDVEVAANGEDVPDGADDDEIEGVTITDAGDPDKITVSLDAVELEDVIRLFTRLSGANIICNTTNLHGTVTANLADIAWKPALKAILRQQGLALIEDEMTPGVYEIGPKPAKGQEPFVTKSFKLNYLKAAEAQKILTNFLGLNSANASKKVSRDKNGNIIEEVEAVANEQKGYVVSYPAANTVIVSCRGENRMREVEQIVHKLDVVRQQVYIEAKIVQVSGNDSKKTGIDWSFLNGYTIGLRDPQNSNNAFTWTRDKTRSNFEITDDVGSAKTSFGGEMQNNGLFSSLYRLDNAHTRPDGTWEASRGRSIENKSESTLNDGKYSVFNADALNLVISALQTSDSFAQISNPKMIVANEQKAVIDMTQKDPYVKIERTQDGTGQDAQIKYSTSLDAIPTPTGADNKVAYIEGAFFSYGIRVEVTPRINNSTNITVEIEPTLSDLQEYYEPGADDGLKLTRYPVINSKSVKTTFSLGNGQTAVIGGLTTTRDRDVVKKIPVLGNIPIIGKYLFSHNEKTKEQIETIIFVTVGIVDQDNRETTMGLPDGARLVQKRIDKNGKIIDKVFEEFEKDDEPATEDDDALPEDIQQEIDEAKAEGVVVPEPVED